MFRARVPPTFSGAAVPCNYCYFSCSTTYVFRYRTGLVLNRINQLFPLDNFQKKKRNRVYISYIYNSIFLWPPINQTAKPTHNAKRLLAPPESRYN